MSDFRKNPVRKVAFKNTKHDPEVGNHFLHRGVEDIDGILIAAEHSLVLMHYPVRSIEQVKQKAINGFRALQDAKDLSKIGAHWRKDFAQYLVDGEQFFGDKVKRYVETVSRGNLQPL